MFGGSYGNLLASWREEAPHSSELKIRINCNVYTVIYPKKVNKLFSILVKQQLKLIQPFVDVINFLAKKVFNVNTVYDWLIVVHNLYHPFDTK